MMRPDMQIRDISPFEYSYTSDQELQILLNGKLKTTYETDCPCPEMNVAASLFEVFNSPKDFSFSSCLSWNFLTLHYFPQTSWDQKGSVEVDA